MPASFSKSALWSFAAIVVVRLGASDLRYSEPAGAVRVTFEPGSRFTGMPLVNQAVIRGTVLNVAGSTLTVGTTSLDLGASLAAGKTYYVELTAGPSSTYVGDRFDVDVTATQANANNTLVVAATSRNTLATIPPTAGLAGYSLVVRPHVTLGQVFGTQGNEIMQGSSSASSADQLQFFNSTTQAWETYYFLRNSTGAIAQWTKIGGGSTSRDNEIIAPGSGFSVVRNASASVTIYLRGNVRTNSFAQPLVAGHNLVAQPWPLARSPLQRQMTTANGMTGATSVPSADQILKYNGTTYATYYLLRNSSGSIEQWTLVGGGSTNRGNEPLFGSDTSVFISKISADPAYLVPDHSEIP